MREANKLYDELIADFRKKYSTPSMSKKREELLQIAYALYNSGYPPNRICSTICRDLSGAMSAQYIRMILPNTFVDNKRANKRYEYTINY